MSDISDQWKFVEAVASEQGVNSETMRKWRERGKVPHQWRLPIFKVAIARGQSLDDTIFDNVPAQAAGAA